MLSGTATLPASSSLPSAGVSSGAALRGEAISVSFSGVQALDGVSLSVEPGAIIGLVGPNGSGKTTLLNVLSGVIHATSGRVLIGDEDLSRLPAERLAARGVARTFQNIRLFGHLTVIENVEVGVALDSARPRGAALRAAARAMLAETELLEVADRYASTLPYGIRRRVEIARALATRPSFMLLDEPAAGTNESESDELRGLIAALRHKYGLGLLVVEHDLRLIMRLADRIAVLNEGHLIAEGDAQHVSHDRLVREAYLGRRAEQEEEKKEAKAEERQATPGSPPVSGSGA